jgi:hypothetical protein
MVKQIPLVNVTVPGSFEIRPGAKVKSMGVPDFLLGKEDKVGSQSVYGFDTGPYAPNCYASSKHNELQALNARVLKKPKYEPDLTYLRRCIDWLKRNHRVLFPHIHNVKSLSFDDYLVGSNASPAVKKILRATYDKLCEEGISESSRLTRVQRHKYTRRSSFVKVENNLYCSPLGTKEKAPRIIQGAAPEFICLVGPWIAALQGCVKKSWSSQNFVTFTSGCDALTLGRTCDRPGWLNIEDDIGAFDTSITEPWCLYEVWLAKQFGAPQAVIDLMMSNIQTHGFTRWGYKYSVVGTRKSGDPYTSLFNSIINAGSHLFIYCDTLSCALRDARHKMHMLVQGDDNLLQHSTRTKLPWQDRMARLGFDSKASYKRNVTELEFCSMRLYKTESGLCFAPKPGKVLAKFGYIVNPPVGVTKESLMRGVAMGLTKSCSFIPPVKAVIDRVMKLTQGHKAVLPAREFDYMLKFTSHLIKPTVDIMEQLDHLYSWSTHCQTTWEQSLQRMKLGDCYDTPLQQLLFDRDTSGPKVIYVC